MKYYASEEPHCLNRNQITNKFSSGVRCQIFSGPPNLDTNLARTFPGGNSICNHRLAE